MPAEATLAGARWLTAPESRRILDVLEAGGREARFVGGCVRDTLLDPPLDEVDLDIATQLRPEDSMARLAAAGIQVVPTGLAHGTVTARLGLRSYEVTTLRRDVTTDGRHAVVAFTDDFAADAARRDFTINALSCDRAGRLFDYFGGQADLRAGMIRFVGDPVARIREDYLRILRFFRFQARLGRGSADASAVAACREERAGLARLAGERVRVELSKLLVARDPLPSLALMEATGVWAAILPAPPDLGRLRSLIDVAPEEGAIARLAALVRGRIDPEAVALRLRLSGAEARLLGHLADRVLPDPPVDPSAVRRLVDALGGPVTAGLLALGWAESKAPAASLAPLRRLALGWSPPAFPLTGDDLLAHGVPPGPGLGRLLASLRAWWVDADFLPDRAACLARLEHRLAAPEP